MLGTAIMKCIFPIAALLLVLTGCGKEEPGPAASESCYNKLRQIDGAKQAWADEHHKTTNDTPTWEDLRGYLKTVPFTCPNGGTYTLGQIGELPTCSIPEDTAYWRKHMEGK
jgi:hypothetical protein